jgi:uncharacterized protein YijF (DUF1287 family)
MPQLNTKLTERLVLLQQIDGLHKDMNSEWIPVSRLFNPEKPDANAKIVANLEQWIGRRKCEDDASVNTALQNIDALALGGLVDRVVIDDKIGTEIRVTNKGYQLIDLLFDAENPALHANAEAVKRPKVKP